MNRFVKINQHSFTLAIPKIVAVAYDYDISLYSDQKYTELGIRYPQHLDKAVTKRKAEYLAGRFAAKEALKNFEISIDQIDADKNRAPIWPYGVIGSITHTNKTAVSVAASDRQFSYLGVDMENIVTIDTAQKLKSMIIDPIEEQVLANIPLDFSALFTLVFSAKESLFKALYPYVNYYFDFSAAKLSELSLKRQTIELKIATDLSKSIPKDMTVKGCFSINNHEVVSLIYKRID